MNKILREIYHMATRLSMKVYSAFHPIEKKVIFDSFSGNQYSDNPKAISEKLHYLYPEYAIVWGMKKAALTSSDIPSYVKVVIEDKKRIAFLKELSTSFCFVTNIAIGSGINKRKNQFFIQTWHGDRGLKKVLYGVDMSGKTVARIMDNQYTDLCIAASNIGVNTYRSAFRYDGEILNVGMPRNDILINDDGSYAKRVRKVLSIPDNAKVLLFAPTFRDGLKKKQKNTVDLLRIIGILNKKDNWVCLLRAHVVSSGIEFECDNTTFFDVSSYPDMADLLCIADLLITDYSSCAGDMILRNKGTILATFDKELYKSNCRELPFDYKEVGFLTAESQSELEKIVENYTEKDYEENCKRLIDYFKINETGKSSEIICNRIDKTYCQRFN